MNEFTFILILLATVLISVGVTYLLMFQKNKLKNNELQSHFKEQQSNLVQEIALATQKEQMLRSNLDELKIAATQWEKEKIELTNHLTQAETNLSNLSEKL